MSERHNQRCEIIHQDVSDSVCSGNARTGGYTDLRSIYAEQVCHDESHSESQGAIVHLFTFYSPKCHEAADSDLTNCKQ